nr:hypothetical protein [Tanacetum cinerariifolium]
MPPKPDLVFHTAHIAVETNHSAFTVQLSPSKHAQDLSYTNRSTTPIIEDWLVKTSIPAGTPKPTSPKSNSSGKRRNRKTCFVCKSVDHLIEDCDYHAKKIAQPTPRNYKHRVSAAVPKIMVTRPRLAHPIVTKSKSPIKRHITHNPSPKTSNSPPRVTAVQALVVSAAQELNGGYVAFGGNPKGGKISGKGKIKTGKFKGKVDEGFLVRYSVNSKAFRVFDSRTCIVQETLHVNFLENKPNNVGSGPIWLFDIDSLIRTMNYQPITTGNQTNSSAGFQDKFDAKKAGEEIDQQYVLFPVWSSGSTNPQKNNEDVAFDEKEHDAKKPESEVNVSLSSSAQSRKQDDKTKKEAKGKKLEYITYSNDANDVGAEADFNNLETFITVSPIPITRIHKDHPVSQIIGELSSTTQTRSMTRVPKDQGGLSQMFNDDFYNCMFSCFLLQVEPKRVHQALKDLSWIEAMQEKLLQFKMQKVWVLVDLPNGKRAIDTKWVYKNKKDERGIVIKNKARLLMPPSWALWCTKWMSRMHFYMALSKRKYTYVNHQGLSILKILTKYTKWSRKIESMHPCTSWVPLKSGKHCRVIALSASPTDAETGADADMTHSGGDTDILQFGELTFFLGLRVKQKKDGIFISQDKYVAEILRKFRLIKGKSASTPIDTEKPLLKDPDGEDVDVHTYRKSTTGGCQFLGCRLIFWQCKKQTVVATSSTEAEYIAAASCCAQVLWIPKQLLDYGLIYWHCKKQTVMATSSIEAEYVAAASCCAQVLWIHNQLLDYGLISCQCKKQTVVATSSTEAEYVATASGCARVLWIQN